jgi:hypothetical protein
MIMRRVHSAVRRAAANGRRGGQTLIVLLVLLVLLTLVVLWNFDLHKIIAVKLRSQNAGDAAALAAARWQGTSLNLIGELNAMQALALHDALTRGSTDFSEAETIADLQARLCYVGPMTAFVAAQHAAKNNNVFVNTSFTADVAAHGQRVAQDYSTRFPEPPFGGGGAAGSGWADYAEMIFAVAAEGVAAAPDNRRLYNDYSSSAHLLLNPGFYDAIASRDWCWFLFNALDALRNYRNWRDWDPLPMIEEPRPMNSEYFSLGLRTVETLEDLGWSSGEDGDAEAALALLSERAGVVLTNAVLRVEARWYVYDPQNWRPWSTMIPDDFPFRGPVREAYNYVGADAAVRIEQRSPRMTPGGGADTVMWTAAAKPFGTLDEGQAPNRYGLVLPAFSDVRLIPVDTSTASTGGSRPGWAEHIYDHIGPYVARGPGVLQPGCWYCAQLYTWENSGFRQQGVLWLEANQEQCHRSGPGPGSPGGGSRRGH